MITYFCLTHRRNLNRYYIAGSEWTGSNGNEGELHIPQTSGTEKSPDSLLSYPGPVLRRSYPSAEMKSKDFTAPAD